ncbi:MAG: hypothetical protein CEO12_110 [Parcubacteria group bacterium Gr01-1014_46]|nr:MAG: hypothetical protein CEO12_110 [Parcubacteria group bacterium Gr01-1014_46]
MSYKDTKISSEMKKDQGFVVRIVLIIVALIAIKYYFHFDIVEWVKSPGVQKYLGFLVTFAKTLYGWLDDLVRGWVS